MQLEVETTLNDVALRLAIDRFVLFVHAVEVKTKEQTTNITHHYGPTAFKLLIDEAQSQSYAMTPRREHISQLDVFAHWIPEALQADKDVVKSFRAKEESHVGALKRAASASASTTPTKKN